MPKSDIVNRIDMNEVQNVYLPWLLFSQQHNTFPCIRQSRQLPISREFLTLSSNRLDFIELYV